MKSIVLVPGEIILFHNESKPDIEDNSNSRIQSVDLTNPIVEQISTEVTPSNNGNNHSFAKEFHDRCQDNLNTSKCESSHFAFDGKKTNIACSIEHQNMLFLQTTSFKWLMQLHWFCLR